MKYKIITSLACLFFIFFANAQQGWLPAKQIVEKFYTIYDASSLPYRRVEFEKRKGDWYIKIIEKRNGAFRGTNPRLFYSAKQNRFLQLDLERNTSKEPVEPLLYMPENDMYNFDIQPFYGYAGWYKDVVKEYGKRKSLSDIELNALARAYSSMAMSPVTDQGQDVTREDRYKMAFKLDAFSDQQLKQFTSLIDSAIEKYRQLSIRNPKFPTRVGDAVDKYANEMMFKFHVLLTFSQKGLNQMVLPKNLYKDSTLKAARAYLNACPEQSIFVSMGDNDLYPLLYVQQAEGFRKDVYIANYTLMSVDRFIYRMAHPHFDSRPIKLSVDTSLYVDRTNEFAFLEENSETLTVPDLINHIRYDKRDENGTLTLYASAIKIPWKSAATKVTVSLAKVPYIFKNHWILLDIIDNLEGRIICFPNKLEDELKGLSGYFTPKSEGLLYTYNN